MTKFWLPFLKMWLPLNVNDGVTDKRVKIISKFSEKWPNFGPLFKNSSRYASVSDIYGSHTFKREAKIWSRFWEFGTLVNFLKIGANIGHNTEVYSNFIERLSIRGKKEKGKSPSFYVCNVVAAQSPRGWHPNLKDVDVSKTFWPYVIMPNYR